MHNIYFIADTHFGHKAIIYMDQRPYQDVPTMNEDLVLKWNAVVNTEDTVYHLGDVFWTTDIIYNILGRLKGRITFLRGNHDNNQCWNTMQKCCPEHTYIDSPYHEFKLNGTRYILCHYPLLTWNKMHGGSWMFYGHVHGNIFDEGKRKSVCANVINYTPISLSDLTEHEAPRKYNG